MGGSQQYGRGPYQGRGGRGGGSYGRGGRDGRGGGSSSGGGRDGRGGGSSSGSPYQGRGGRGCGEGSSSGGPYQGGGGRGRGWVSSSSGGRGEGGGSRGGESSSSLENVQDLQSILESISALQFPPSLKAIAAIQSAPRPSPSPDRVGQESKVLTNYFFLDDIKSQNLCLYKYQVMGTVSRNLINMWVTSLNSNDTRDIVIAFDGGNQLYMNKALSFERGWKCFKFTGDRKSKYFKIVVKNNGVVYLKNLGSEVIKSLNVVVRDSIMNQPDLYHQMGGFFSLCQGGHNLSLGDGLEGCIVFKPTICATQENGLAERIDTSFRTIIKPLPVIDFVREVNGFLDDSTVLPKSCCERIQKALKRVEVRDRHGRNYKIYGLSRETTQNLFFTWKTKLCKEGINISIVDFYQTKHGIKILYGNLPCLKVDKNAYLPMEVCTIVDNQICSKELAWGKVIALLKTYTPQKRLKDIEKFSDYGDDDGLMNFGIKKMNTLASVDARILPAPNMKYLDQKGIQKVFQPTGGKWDIADMQMVNGGRVEEWMCMVISDHVTKEVAKDFCDNLSKMCRTLGMKFNPDPVNIILLPNLVGVEEALRKQHRVSRDNGKHLDLFIGVLPNSKVPFYGDLKRICETELGLVSQFCTEKLVLKPKSEYFQNLVMKINVKVGGRNTRILYEGIPIVTEKSTIIFGADVTHPSVRDLSSPSIAAVVATMDWPEMTRYVARVSTQARHQELIKDISSSVEELLDSFRRANDGKLPKCIIFYRDGVGEGQFDQILKCELIKIYEACTSVEKGYKPLVTFVVVQKRHHTRLFRHDTDGSIGNTKPGTVVDSGICHPTEFDFYLCSHACELGTSRPAHYRVLHDDNKFTAHQLQRLTNDLCYTYARGTRSAPIVAPVLYAHNAAYRARSYLDPKPPDTGSSGAAPRQRGTYGASPGEAAGPTPKLRNLNPVVEDFKNNMYFC